MFLIVALWLKFIVQLDLLRSIKFPWAWKHLKSRISTNVYSFYKNKVYKSIQAQDR